MAARTGSSRAPRPTASTTLGFLLASVGQRTQSEFRQALAALDRHPRAFGVLLALDEAGALSQQQLSRRLGVPPSRVVPADVRLAIAHLPSPTCGARSPAASRRPSWRGRPA